MTTSSFCLVDARVRASENREQRRAGDDEREPGEAEVAARAAGRSFMEEQHPGGDRHRVRQERREADRRQRVPALEAELQARERETARGGDQRHEQRPSEQRRLRGDVGGAVARAGSEPEADAPAHHERRRECRERDPHEPDRLRARGGVPAAVASAERRAEQRQPGDRDGDGNPVGARERAPLEVEEQRQHADPARRDGLDERERRQAEGGDVEGPAGESDVEAAEPRPGREERSQGRERTARRERRERRRGAVLGEEAPVERECRRQREGEAACDGRAHRRADWKGR
jgi:colicin import membrane protein